jgi:hypothetical protein
MSIYVVRNEELKSYILIGHKFIEPRSFKWKKNFISTMDSVEDYVRRWANPKKELDSLSKWFKSIKGFFKFHIKHVQSNLSLCVS